MEAIPTVNDGFWCDECRAYGEDSPATEILRFEGEDEFLCSPCFERRCERYMNPYPGRAYPTAENH